MYFIDDEIYFKGEKQPPRKVKLHIVKKIDDEMAQCFDEDGNEYMVEVSKYMMMIKENLKLILFIFSKKILFKKLVKMSNMLETIKTRIFLVIPTL